MKKSLQIFILIGLAGITMKAQTQLWGLAQSGGINGLGTIFTADGNGNNFHAVYSMIDSTGDDPYGNLVLANNGKLYGTTARGGCNDSCVCFSFDPITEVYTMVHDNGCDHIHGSGNFTGMLLASDGNLYGTCPGGGANSFGVIYKINPYTNNYTDIYDFAGSGNNPYCTLSELRNGKLYGMTFYGGTHSAGVIFRFDISNSTYTLLHSFNMPTGGEPEYGGLIKASNGKLYGIAQGGANTAGVIFSYDDSLNIYLDVHDFDGPNGSNPYCSLVQATDGKLYGTTSSGGADNYGVIFSFDINTNTFTNLFNFNGINGSGSRSTLLQGSNGKLFGTTSHGGTNNYGVAYSYDISTNIYSVLVNFSNSIGGNSYGGFIETPQFTTAIPTIQYPGNISIYPNPTTNTITIHQDTYSPNQQIVITDVLGNRVYSQALYTASETIDISHLSSGIYFYEVSGKRGKIVKQ